MEGTLMLNGRCVMAVESLKETLKCNTNDAMRAALIYTYLSTKDDASNRKMLRLTQVLCKASDEIDAEEDETQEAVNG